MHPFSFKSLVVSLSFSTATLCLPQILAAGGTSSPPSPDATLNCFPYGSAQLDANYEAPGVPRDQWWCPKESQYGFQGFSYPLEDSDCSGSDDSFDKMNEDFAEMKENFRAKVYYPGCTKSTLFENLLKAGVANNMAVIPQIWFGFDGDVGTI